MLPYLDRRPPWFAFLVHFRDTEDLYRLGGSSFLRQYSHDHDDFQHKMCSLPPLVAADIQFRFAPAKGELVSITRMPESFLGPGGLPLVIEGARLAAERGARVIGLGALTAPASGAGEKLLPFLRPGVTVTTGNAYTSAVVRSNVVEASEAIGLFHHARVAVVGCTGSVGVPASLLLVDAGFRPILIGRTMERVREELGHLEDRAILSNNIRDAEDADIVVFLTSGSTAHLRPECVRPGTILIDCAQPANVSRGEQIEFKRRGVVVVEGGIVQIPDYHCTIDLGLPGPQDAFACLAETYLFAKEGIREHSVGRPSINRALQMERAAQRHGIRPRSLELSRLVPMCQ